MNSKFNTALLVSMAVAGSALSSQSAQAATATGTFNASITIQSSCQVITTNSLAFGTQGILTSNTDTSAALVVQCTNTTPYNVGLDAGTTSGGTVTTRLMTNGTSTVSYKMYADAGHTTNWGNTVGTDTVSGTGTGAQQTLTIHGRVPVQTTPSPSIYSDTVTATITY